MSWAAELIKAQDGDVVIIPLALVRKLGLPAAAFLRQAAYLSAVVERNGGWFFLEQEGSANENGKSIFERYGSWHASLGIGPDAQAAIRKQLRGIRLLEETRKGTVHGKLLYRVDPERYLNFLASCYSPSPTSQTGNPDCANREPRLSNPDKSDCSIGKNPYDIYQEDLSSKTTTTTTEPLKTAGSGCELNNLLIEPALALFEPQIINVLAQANISDSALAQDLVDELAGRIEAGQRGDKPKVASPLDLLRTYVSRDQEGRFDRIHCLSVQARRLRLAEEVELRSQPHKRSPMPESARAAFDSILGRRG
jgi:hypothetical protein